MEIRNGLDVKEIDTQNDSDQDGFPNTKQKGTSFTK